MLIKLALGNVRKSIRDFSVFFLTLAFGVCAFYAFGSLSDQAAVIQMTSDQRASVQSLMGIFSGVSVFLAVILGFLVVYANRFLIRRRKREFGVYLTLGMRRGQVAAIIATETLSVGVAALAVGLAAGVLLSQLMTYVTARLFETTVAGFSLVLSPRAAAQTVECFALMFAVSLVFNVGTVSRFRLIDLLRADKVSEKVKLRSLPLSVALFVVSLALIGFAYKTLLDHGILSDGPWFGLATLLVSVGTALFFFSISGFLLRLVQSSKGIYLRGLNMFVLRQLNSRVNTAWVSITMVCAMLFVAVCGVCTGLSISWNMNQAILEGTAYDATITYYPRGYSGSEDRGEGALAAQACDYDMAGVLSDDVPEWDSLVRDAARVRLYEPSTDEGGLPVAWALEHTEGDFGSIANQLFTANGERCLDMVRLSDYNALRALLGKKPVELAADECLVWNDLATLDDLWGAFAAQNRELAVMGRTLRPRAELAREHIGDSIGVTITGTLVVPDDVLPDRAVPYLCYLNVMFAGSREATQQPFLDALEAALAAEASPEARFFNGAGMVGTVNTALDLRDATGSATITITYLAIYIGFILLITCASVLAIQQLSEASDNAARYRVLFELGAEPAMVRRALMAQIAVYFVFPLVVAVCHAACALKSVNDLVELLTGYRIGTALAATVCFVVALYGGYFLVTYRTSRSMIARA